MTSNSSSSVPTAEPLEINCLDFVINLYRLHEEYPKGRLTHELYSNIMEISRTQDTQLDERSLQVIKQMGIASRAFQAAEEKKVLSLSRKYKVFRVFLTIVISLIISKLKKCHSNCFYSVVKEEESQ